MTVALLITPLLIAETACAFTSDAKQSARPVSLLRSTTESEEAVVVASAETTPEQTPDFQNSPFCTLLDGDDQVSVGTCSVASPALSLNLESPRLGVSFSTDVTTHYVLHRNEFSSEEKMASWYCKEECKEIKDSVKDVVARMESGEDDEYCTRGLESRIRKGALRKRKNKVDARAAVFLEQEMQHADNGIFDPEAIADIYYDYSEHCQASAEMMGLRDEKEAEAAWASPKSTVLEYSYSRVVLNLQSSESRTIVLSSAA